MSSSHHCIIALQHPLPQPPTHSAQTRRAAQSTHSRAAEPADSAGTHSSLAASPSLPPLGVERMGAHLPSLAASLPRCPPCLPHHPHPKRARAFTALQCALWAARSCMGSSAASFSSPPSLSSSSSMPSGLPVEPFPDPKQGRTVADGTLPKPKRCAKISNTLLTLPYAPSAPYVR